MSEVASTIAVQIPGEVLEQRKWLECWEIDRLYRT